MNIPPDFIHLFIHQFWRILKMDYLSLVRKRAIWIPQNQMVDRMKDFWYDLWEGRYVKVRKKGFIIYPHLNLSRIMCLLSYSTDNQFFIVLKRQGLVIKILGQRQGPFFSVDLGASDPRK